MSLLPQIVYEVPEETARVACAPFPKGTHSQGVRRCDLRQARYLGIVKTHLQQILTAVALNLIRIAE